MKRINVAGGGLGNGNAYAEIQVIYEDKDMCEIKAVFYEEFGNNHYRKIIGDDIEWGEDDNFKVLNHGKYVDSSDEEEEDEEEDWETKRCVRCNYLDTLSHFGDTIDGEYVITDECKGCFVENEDDEN